MRGRKQLPYRLREADRQALEALLDDGHLSQWVASRTQALLSLDRGERNQAVIHWLGWSRADLWHLCQWE
jgi:hypothetical protein